ncbi:MAG TPA: hypothetical protein VLF89_00175 [Candidatus Saccharimonadales bacterium]|nr:hypothetical protein [Candidatus Saccharimonadales bacterium]
MTDKQDPHKANPIKPVIAGAALGAAVAAGAVILTDKKKREKVIQTMHTMKDKTNHMMHQAKIKVDEMRESADDLRKDVDDMLDDTNTAKKKLSS